LADARVPMTPPVPPRPTDSPPGPADPFSANGRQLPEEGAAAGSGKGEPEGEEKKQAPHRSFWKELPLLILVALVVAILIKTFLVQVFWIPSGSMRDTLIEGDRVMVNKLAYRLGEPHRGDIIVFDNPEAAGTDGETVFGALLRHVVESLGVSSPDTVLIKRVVALGGETVQIREGRVYVDGIAIDEPYIKDGSTMPDYGPIAVDIGYVFVMGDNRNSSTDSRVFGPIAEKRIVGKAFLRVWPPSRLGGL
jgi:signal peptidase I